MSTPNPLAPKGSLLEQQGRGKSTMQIITFIGALHVFFLCGLLWIGCKKDDHPPAGTDPLASNPQPGTPDTNALPITPGGVASNVAPVTPLVPPVGATSGPVVALPPPVTPGPGTVGTPGGTTPPTTAENPPQGGTAGGDYKVQKGDTGVTIAKKNNVSLAALKAANPNVKWTALRVDQHIQIPAADAVKPAPGGTGVGNGQAPQPDAGITPTAEGTVYEVKPGDTGSKIAHKFGVSWKAIRAANHLESDNIKPKQKLTIPAKSGGGAAAPAPAPAPAVNPVAVPVVPTATPIPAPATGVPRQ